MDELKKLREQLKAKLEEARKLHDKYKAEKRALTPEEQAAWDALAKEVDDLKMRVADLEAKQNPAGSTTTEGASDAARSTWLASTDADLARASERRTTPRTSGGADEGRRTNTTQTEARWRRVQVPSRAYRAQQLKAFRGEGAEQRAYIAGQFFRATILGDDQARAWCKDLGIELRTAQAEGVNSLGGYLVPEEVASAIIDLREEYGTFRRNAHIWPMLSDTAFIPRRLTGLTAYFVAENSEIPESNMTFDGVQLTARKLAVLCKFSTEVDEDAVVNFGDMITNEIAYAMAYKEDLCGWLGDGTSTYGGITGVVTKINNGSYAGGIYTAATGNTAYGTLDIEDFIGVMGMLPVYALPGAKWYVSNPAFAASMARLAYAQGGNTVDNVAGKPVMSFLGYPVELVNVLNSTLTAQVSTIVALFGNLSLAATMGTRRQITIKRSEERYFEFDQIGIKGTERFDINVHDLGGAATAGPLVALKTPAS